MTNRNVVRASLVAAVSIDAGRGQLLFATSIRRRIRGQRARALIRAHLSNDSSNIVTRRRLPAMDVLATLANAGWRTQPCTDSSAELSIAQQQLPGSMPRQSKSSLLQGDRLRELNGRQAWVSVCRCRLRSVYV